MLGRALASVCATLDVTTVFLSGNVIDVLGDPMLESMHRELAARSRLKNLSGLSGYRAPRASVAPDRGRVARAPLIAEG